MAGVSAHCVHAPRGRSHDPGFSYELFTTRNIGFVTEAEQARLRQATIFVCGVGGMVEPLFMALVRAGIGRFVIADIDVFEVSNLNRQVFANAGTVGRPKAEAAAEAARAINPEIEIEVLEPNGRSACRRSRDAAR